MLQRSISDLLIETGAQQLVKGIFNDPTQSCRWKGVKHICFSEARNEEFLHQIIKMAKIVGVKPHKAD